MNDVPEGMRTMGRPVIPDFPPEERLYRRVRPEDWDDGHIALDAIELPDMSVNRSSLGPAWWARIVGETRYEGWAVVGFQVGDIPEPMLHQGVETFSFKPAHVPLKNNYPHSEVRCYVGDGHGAPVHVDGKKTPLPHDVLQRWRERLRRRLKTVIRPDEPSPDE